jgi:basic membrane protein A
MKKVLALVLALVMALALTACGSNAPATSSEPSGSAAASTEASVAPDESAAASTAPAEGKTYKIAMVCDSSISDGGWGAACYNAMVSAAADLGWETQYTDSIDVADYVTSIESYCQLGYDMIFLPGNQYSDATVQVAKDYPDIAFAVLNGAESLPTDNIMSMLPNAQEIGWMAGSLAGLMSKSSVLGFIGGMELDTTKAKLASYEEAAKVVNPNITVLSAYAGSFNDTAKGMELATSMISQKADVFFGDASAVDSGARQAIDAANNTSGAISIYNIGQPADLLGQNPCVISSVVTDNAGMLKICMQAVVDGNFGNEVVYGSLENGCLSVGKINTDLVSQEIQDKFAAYIEQMKAGQFPG